MFNQLFVKNHALKRHLEKPLLQERLEYLRYWHERGATNGTLRIIAQRLLNIIDFLSLDCKRVLTISEIEKSANKWNKHLFKNSKNRSLKYTKYIIDRLIKTSIHWFGMLNFLKYPHKVSELFSKQLIKYEKYMREEQGLSETSIKNKLYLLKNIFKNIPDKNHLLRKITSLSIDKILKQRHDEGYSRRSIQNCVSTIRVFLIYTENQGWSLKGVSKSIFSPRIYSYESLPQGPSWDDVIKLLATTEGDNPNNIRDRAILMLLSVYGLRSSEVARLRLDDIDWKKEIIFISRAKNAKPQKFPLSRYVGRSILRYIKDVRPKFVSCREIFICERAPYLPITTLAIYSAVTKRWKLFDAHIKSYGPHSLRHACATHLINKGISLKEISDYLGHKNIDTTRIYTKVDINNLRKVSEFNIGDLL